MAKLNYDIKDQVNALGDKLKNVEIENTRLTAIIESAFRKINELESQVKEKSDKK